MLGYCQKGQLESKSLTAQTTTLAFAAMAPCLPGGCAASGTRYASDPHHPARDLKFDLRDTWPQAQATQHVAFVNWLLTNILETLPSRIMRMVGTGWLTTVAI